jgi:hypothetical protein
MESSPSRSNERVDSDRAARLDATDSVEAAFPSAAARGRA